MARQTSLGVPGNILGHPRLPTTVLAQGLGTGSDELRRAA